MNMRWIRLLLSLHIATLLVVLSSSIFVVVNGFASEDPNRPSPSSKSEGDNSNDIPPPPPRKTPDEKQAAMMKKMGYKWDGVKWYRGDRDRYILNKASVRSGNRFCRFVVVDKFSATQQPVTKTAASPSGTVAARRLEEVLQAAREGALPARTQKAIAFDRDIKNFLQKPEAPPLWYAAQLLVLFVLVQISGIDAATEISRILSPGTVVIGVSAGLIVAECRSKLRKCQPGIEEDIGRIERLLADGAIGDFAMPSPTHIRYENNNWKAFALFGETLALMNSAVLVNGIAQHAIVSGINKNLLDLWQIDDMTANIDGVNMYIDLIGAVGAVITVAMPSLFIALRKSSGALDGISAECDAASRTQRGAAVYYNMRPPTNCDAVDAADALSALAKGWVDKFGVVFDGVRWKLPFFSFALSATSAAAYQLSGGAILAPVLARVIGSLDAYTIRCDIEQNRASVPLPPERKQESV